MNKTITIIVAAALLVAGGAFYGGMKYGQSNPPAGGALGNFANLRNLSSQERQQMGAGMAGSFGSRAGNQSGAGFVNGDIIAKDNQSITVKMRDNSSKIIFYSGTTEISKFASGASGDLEVGKTVTINGTVNSDGSLTAQSIQVRPAQQPATQ